MSLLPQTRTHADPLYRQSALCGGDEYAVYALAALQQATCQLRYLWMWGEQMAS